MSAGSYFGTVTSETMNTLKCNNNTKSEPIKSINPETNGSLIYPSRDSCNDGIGVLRGVGTCGLTPGQTKASSGHFPIVALPDTTSAELAASMMPWTATVELVSHQREDKMAKRATFWVFKGVCKIILFH